LVDGDFLGRIGLAAFAPTRASLSDTSAMHNTLILTM